MKVTKAVFPVAGLGTRFLPATKASPKEMLPVVDKPLIQYAVEEAVAAGITDMIFVTGRTKRSIEDHFDKAYELETELERRGKTDTLAQVRNLLPSHVKCIYIRQAEALGLGHAVLCAQPVVGVMCSRPASFTTWPSWAKGPGARFNSPTALAHCWPKNRCWPSATRACVTTAAANWATCKPPWPWR